MKVGFLVDTLSVEKGTGIARYSNQLINGLEHAGFNVECIYPGAPDAPVAGIIGHAIKQPYSILKKRNTYDLFHANCPVTSLGLLLTKKPKIVTYHDLASILYQPEANWHVKVLAPYFYKIGKHCDFAISDSTQTRYEMIKYLDFPEENVVVINLGVDDKFSPIPKDERNYFVLGYLGAISPRKRVDFLINVLYRLKKSHGDLKIKLMICGRKTPHHEPLKNMISELGLASNVEFVYFVPEEQLNETYNSFDIFVIPSEWEGFGIPILEAQRCGIPTFIRESAHIPAEVTGSCIKCKNEEDMASKIYELLTDEKKYRAISKQGIEYSNGFTWDKMVKETIEVYKRIL